MTARHADDILKDRAPHGGLELDRFLPYRLSVLANRISRALARRYAEQFGLSIPEWRVVAVLAGRQPLSSNVVCERTSMDKAKVSRAVAGLLRKGLITRTPNAHDQRLVVLRLTPAGTATYRRIEPLALEFERQLLAGLDADERAALELLVERLAGRVDALNHAPPSHEAPA